MTAYPPREWPRIRTKWFDQAAEQSGLLLSIQRVITAGTFGSNHCLGVRRQFDCAAETLRCIHKVYPATKFVRQEVVDHAAAVTLSRGRRNGRTSDLVPFNLEPRSRGALGHQCPSHSNLPTWPRQ